MTISLDAFVAKYDGKRITAPGGIGGQCVDLANEYILECFGDPHEWKNAIDWFGFDPAHFLWVTNNPHDLAQIPPRGALMVWGPDSQIGTGSLGHIDVVLSAGPQSFVGFDQNWPVGAYAHHVAHSYAGIKGWGIPRALLTPAPTPAPVPAPPAPAPSPAQPPAPLPQPAPKPDPAPAPTPPPEVPPVASNPPVNPTPAAPVPPAPPIVIPPLPPEVVPPVIPEPPIVAEQGVTTSEWAALVRYGIQAAGVGTAQLVNAVSEQVWHVGVVIPQSVQLFVGGLEVAGAIAVAGYAISRGIRKLHAR